jgi:hypothetical protein
MTDPTVPQAPTSALRCCTRGADFSRRAEVLSVELAGAWWCSGTCPPRWVLVTTSPGLRLHSVLSDPMLPGPSDTGVRGWKRVAGDRIARPGWLPGCPNLVPVRRDARTLELMDPWPGCASARRATRGPRAQRASEHGRRPSSRPRSPPNFGGILIWIVRASPGAGRPHPFQGRQPRAQPPPVHRQALAAPLPRLSPGL